jgi:hypothetical protein
MFLFNLVAAEAFVSCTTCKLKIGSIDQIKTIVSNVIDISIFPLNLWKKEEKKVEQDNEEKERTQLNTYYDKDIYNDTITMTTHTTYHLWLS